MKILVMKEPLSVSIGPYYERFIKQRVAEGRYGSVDEVLRTALRLLEEEEDKVSMLKSAIAQGLESGLATDFDPRNHLTSLKAARRPNG